MRLTVGGVLTDALGMFRRNADLLIRIAAPFVFLPAYAIELLVPPPPAMPAGATDQAARLDWLETFEAWAGAHGGWYLLNFAIASFGMLAILLLLIDKDRPTIGEALKRSLGVAYLRYLIAMLLVGLVTGLGLLLFILPGVLVAGRVIVTGPAIVSDPRSSAVGAIRRSLRLTSGQTLTVMAIAALTVIGGWVLSAPLQAIDTVLRENRIDNPVAVAMVDALVAAVTMLISLATVLIQIAVWRRLRR